MYDCLHWSYELVLLEAKVVNVEAPNAGITATSLVARAGAAIASQMGHAAIAIVTVVRVL